MPRTIAYRAGGFTNCGISYTKFSQEELAEMKDRVVTENEAIELLKNNYPKTCKMVEKQTAKRPDYEGDGYADGHLVYDTWICPCCGKHYEIDYDDYDFCPACGQCIDWSDEE